MESYGSEHILISTVNQMMTLFNSLTALMSADQFSAGMTNHPMVQASIYMYVNSAPIGTLILSIGGLGGFLIFMSLFGSWTEFKNWVKSIEISLAGEDIQDEENDLGRGGNRT